MPKCRSKTRRKVALYGRRREIETLFALMRVRSSTATRLVIRGEPASEVPPFWLPRQHRGTSQRIPVLTATGVQSEAELPFAGLDQLTRAIRWDADSLPDPQRNAVLAAFGKASSATPDSFLIALATLDLLADAAASAPILIVADDAQWLDRPTSDVLTFVARRLESDPTRCCLRSETTARVLSSERAQRAAAHRSGESDAEAILDERAPHLNASIRKTLLDEARGNPLALIDYRSQCRTTGTRIDRNRQSLSC